MGSSAPSGPVSGAPGRKKSKKHYKKQEFRILGHQKVEIPGGLGLGLGWESATIDVPGEGWAGKAELLISCVI